MAALFCEDSYDRDESSQDHDGLATDCANDPFQELCLYRRDFGLELGSFKMSLIPERAGEPERIEQKSSDSGKMRRTGAKVPRRVALRARPGQAIAP